MNKDRKVNIIRDLKEEIIFYKKQLIPVNTIDRTRLNHLKLSIAFTPEEIITMPADAKEDLIAHRMTKVFADSVMQMPIETEFDFQQNRYKATLDLWTR
jgi:hypothetical protein